MINRKLFFGPGVTVMSLILVLAVSGCGFLAQYRFEASRRAALKKIDVAACRARGGSVQPVCMFQFPACVIPFPDGGKPCTDSSQCQGMCWLRESALNGDNSGPVVGSCQEDTDTCGCYAEVRNGRSSRGMCVD